MLRTVVAYGLAVVLFMLVIFMLDANGANAGVSSHLPDTPGCSENGPCVVVETINFIPTAVKPWEKHGAEYWHWENKKAQRKIVKLQKRLNKKNRVDAKYAIKLAASAFSLSESAMRSVAWCESKFNTYARNRSSASGLFQFINSTWRNSGMAVFSVFDPIANALGAAKTVRADGGWGQWSCKP